MSKDIQQSQSRRPCTNPWHTPEEVEKIVRMVRLSLYNQELFCGDQAILWELDELGVSPRPSLGCNTKKLQLV